MRLVLFVSSLRCGGTERVVSSLANAWAEKGWLVHVVTMDQVSTDFYRLHPHIVRRSLNLIAPSSNGLLAIMRNSKRVTAFRREFKAAVPDVVVSFGDHTNVLSLLATRGTGVPAVVSERSDPTRVPFERSWSWARRVLYPRASAVVVQTDSVRHWMHSFVNPSRIHVLPNPIGAAFCQQVTRPARNGCRVVAMGRLSHEKGFDLLIRAFAASRCRTLGAQLTILGEGDQRDRLSTLCSELRVSDTVRMPGILSDPSELLRNADLFVLSSRYEGFPNALLEAMACGLPAVSFDCPSGPAEIITHGQDGLLVPPEDVRALREAIDALASDETKRTLMSRNARRVIDRFHETKVTAAWTALLESLGPGRACSGGEDRHPEGLQAREIPP